MYTSMLKVVVVVLGAVLAVLRVLRKSAFDDALIFS